VILCLNPEQVVIVLYLMLVKRKYIPDKSHQLSLDAAFEENRVMKAMANSKIKNIMKEKLSIMRN
jgi:hypothetical protein